MCNVKTLQKSADKVFNKLGLPRLRIYLTRGSSMFIPTIGYGVIPGKILIHSSLSQREAKEHLYHEIGHYIQSYQKINIVSLFGSGDLVNLYFNYFIDFVSSLFDFENGKNEDEYISEYSMVHPYEDFAETFCYALKDYLGGKECVYENRVLNRKYQFCMNLIKESSA